MSIPKSQITRRRALVTAGAAASVVAMPSIVRAADAKLKIGAQLLSQECRGMVVSPEFGLRMEKKIHHRAAPPKDRLQPFLLQVIVDRLDALELPASRLLQKESCQHAGDHTVKAGEMDVECRAFSPKED